MRLIINLLFCLPGLISDGFSQRVTIHQLDQSPQTMYAVGALKKALLGSHYTLTAVKADYTIDLLIAREKLENEAYNVAPNGKVITIKGGDARGLIYGCLAVAEEMQNGVSLTAIKIQTEKPHLPFRAIKFDLPWDTYRHSYSLDQHVETCRDVAYWERFLDMMVKNRFNALSLWNLHPYTYMIKPKNFPEASPFTDKELARWQHLHRAIFRMAKERAIDTYLIPFNIFVSPEFAKAHNVAMDNLAHNFFVNGDTSAIVKRYTRECVTQVLQEYPELTGFGLTLGEGMGGMTPQQREDWMKETIIEGMRLANRKSKIVHRIPFSSTTGSLGITSIDTEKLTRKAIDDEGDLDFLEGPIWADLKYNWSHAHSTPKLIKVHGGKLFDTYFKPEPTKYKITWTARNEDFFCLRWGVPNFIRAHVAANNQAYVGGYFIGSETYIPAKDYFTKPGGPVDWTYAFERQWLFYKLWGRLMYNPATPDTVFKSEFTRRYGKGAATLLEAYALASSTPLRLASSFDFTWDFSLYSEGMMAHDAKKNVSYISVEQQITQATLDPDYVSVKDYVKASLSGSSFESNKITPPILAGMLESDCQKALQLVKPINTSSNRSLQYEVADVQVWANLGLHLAEKLKAAVALQTYRLSGGEANKQAAVQHLEAALRYWDVVVAITRPLYNDMPLVHLTEQKGSTWEENNKLRFHWATLRPVVAKDIEVARNAQFSAN
jgi:hypothetical protein